MDIKDAVLNVMGTSFFGNLVTLIVGLFGMAGVVYTVKKSQKSAFTSAYFSQKLSAYSDFIQCIERYLWHPDKEATWARKVSLLHGGASKAKLTL